MKIFFDGCCRPNPGPMQTMVVAGGQVFHHNTLGEGDNNDAEWLALIHALTVARSLGLADVTLLGDFSLIVNQAQGTVACRAPRFTARLAEFRALTGHFERVRLHHIRRTQNLAGIALERIHGRL